MTDPVAEQFPWLDGIFANAGNVALFETESERVLAAVLCRRWPSENRLNLLRDLAAKFGEPAVCSTIDRIVSTNCRRDWEQIGREDGDNSFERFYAKLWAPLPAMGFEFTRERTGDEVRFNVTRCPVAELARRLSAENWFYHLLCLTDEPAVTGFNRNIRFTRTRTLMQGDSCCDHCYTDSAADRNSGA